MVTVFAETDQQSLSGSDLFRPRASSSTIRISRAYLGDQRGRESPADQEDQARGVPETRCRREHGQGQGRAYGRARARDRRWQIDQGGDQTDRDRPGRVPFEEDRGFLHGLT